MKAYRPTRSLTVYRKVGRVKSNTYIGASCAIGKLYTEVVLTQNDELHDLGDGILIFAVTSEGVFLVSFHINEKHPFEKSYGPPIRHDVSALGGIERIGLEDAAQIEQYDPYAVVDTHLNEMEEARDRGFVPHKNGIDWVRPAMAESGISQ